MADEKANKPRVEVKDLPQPEKELSTDEQKEVKGGTMHHIISDGWSSPKSGGAQDQTEANRGAAIDPNG